MRIGKGVGDGIGVGEFVVAPLDVRLELLGDELGWLDDELVADDELGWLDDELVLGDELGCELTDELALNDRSGGFADELVLADELIDELCELVILDEEETRTGISGKSDPSFTFKLGLSGLFGSGLFDELAALDDERAGAGGAELDDELGTMLTELDDELGTVLTELDDELGGGGVTRCRDPMLATGVAFLKENAIEMPSAISPNKRRRKYLRI